MNQEHSGNDMEKSLDEIRTLLSQLHGEVTVLEASYSQVLEVLQGFEKICNIDELTGILRRRAFFVQWQALLNECKRVGESCGILMIDIDHFKQINDAYGHPTGDEVIRRVAGLLKQFESPDNFAGRLGGEEFVLAVRGPDALETAEKIRTAAEELRGETGNREWQCTISIGVADGAAAGFDSDRLLQAADEALYVAKRNGRNQVRAA